MQDLQGDGSKSSSRLRQFLRVAATFAWDVLIGVIIIALLVLVLFALSGVWPPFVAIESGSMEPNMNEGDLVFLVDEDRYVSHSGGGETGLITHEEGKEIGHIAFGKPGHVVVFDVGDGSTPIIHRLHLWVEEGENWYERANPDYLGPAESCEDLVMCPAPYDGYITKGDANDNYDQINNNIEIVKPEWIEGRAAIRIPYLGKLRLSLSASLEAGLDVGLNFPDLREAGI